MHDFPQDIMIEVTNECNLRCITCYSHQDWRKREYMPFSVYQKVIDEIPEKNNKSISLYNYWEPLLHPEIWKMIGYAKWSGIKNIKIATNGTILNLKKIIEIVKGWLDYISISIDWTTQDVYEIFRIWWSLFNVIRNIKNLVRIKEDLQSSLIIELQFIIMRHNEWQIEDIMKLAKELKVDLLRYKTVLIKDKKWEYLLPSNKKYSRYTNTSVKYCNKPKESIVVNVDGKIIPCCYITDNFITKYTFWNIKNENFQEVFSKNKNQQFIKEVTTDKSNTDYCKDCSEWNLNLNYKLIKLNYDS